MKLNLGCRTDILPGWTNLDFDTSLKNVDVFHDLNVIPYPFPDNSVEEIRMWHVMEHLDHPRECLKELYRICKDGAEIHIRLPHFSQGGCWGDETHRHGCSTKFLGTSIEYTGVNMEITQMSLHYRQEREGMGAVGKLQNAMLNSVFDLMPIGFFERYFLYWIGGVEEIDCWITVHKNGTN